MSAPLYIQLSPGRGFRSKLLRGVSGKIVSYRGRDADGWDWYDVTYQKANCADLVHQCRRDGLLPDSARNGS